jgi:hypothetical protein
MVKTMSRKLIPLVMLVFTPMALGVGLYILTPLSDG